MGQGAAAWAVPLGVSLLGGLMGDSGSQQSMAPSIIPGLGISGQSLGQTLLRYLGKGLTPEVPTPGLSLSPSEESLVGALPYMDFASAIKQALGNTQTIGGLGFLDDLATRLRPGMIDKPFDEGAAAIREQSALTGSLSSSGTLNQIMDFRGDLESTFQQMLPQIGAQLGSLQLEASKNALADAVGLVGLSGDLNRGLPQQNFQNLLASRELSQGGAAGMLGALGGGSGLSSLFYQPRTSPGKGESMASIAAPIAGAGFANRQGSSGGGGFKGAQPGKG